MNEAEYWKRLQQIKAFRVERPDRWGAHREAMREHLRIGPPDKPWTFSTVVATMYVGDGKLVRKEAAEMAAAGEMAHYLDEDGTNLLHQHYHLWRWRGRQGANALARVKTIVEFGGGYGAMAIVAERCGFRGEYWIADFPEMNMMQWWHLGKRGISLEMHWVTEARPCERPDLFISCFGLSEVTPLERVKFLRQIQPRSYLMVYQRRWDGVDNERFFQIWAEEYQKKGGPQFVIEDGPSGRYLISVEKGQDE